MRDLMAYHDDEASLMKVQSFVALPSISHSRLIIAPAIMTTLHHIYQLFHPYYKNLQAIRRYPRTLEQVNTVKPLTM